MILGLGLDVVELARIAGIFARFGAKFAQKILCEAELERLPRTPIAYLASRFAAKEAAVKALGTGFSGGITLLSIEVAKNERGAPLLLLHGQARRRFEEMGGRKTHLSLTHARDTAAAVVVLET